MRRAVLVLIVLAGVAVLPTVPAASAPTGAAGDVTPAAPDPNTYPVVLSGDFTGDGVGDLFFHSPSSAPDVMYEFNPQGGPDAQPVWIHTYSVQGSYRPVVGNFGKNSDEDIVWYRPGTGSDVIWDFNHAIGTSSRPDYTRRPITVNGHYTPVAGSFYPPGPQDILWYGRGSITDSVWDFYTPCGGCAVTHKARPINVNGTGYEPVAGNFVQHAGGMDDVFWYNPNGPESLWVFSHPIDYKYTAISDAAIQVRGSTYELAVADLFANGFEDIVFVAPGSTTDAVWDFFNEAFIRKLGTPEPLDGDYRAVTGVHANDFEVPEDFFVYDPTATAGRYFDVTDVGPEEILYARIDFDPAPLTELPPEEPTASASATAPKGRRWWIEPGGTSRVAR